MQQGDTPVLSRTWRGKSATQYRLTEVGEGGARKSSLTGWKRSGFWFGSNEHIPDLISINPVSRLGGRLN